MNETMLHSAVYFNHV